MRCYTGLLWVLVVSVPAAGWAQRMVPDTVLYTPVVLAEQVAQAQAQIDSLARAGTERSKQEVWQRIRFEALYQGAADFFEPTTLAMLEFVTSSRTGSPEGMRLYRAPHRFRVGEGTYNFLVRTTEQGQLRRTTRQTPRTVIYGIFVGHADPYGVLQWSVLVEYTNPFAPPR